VSDFYTTELNILFKI